jgi:hypothetical protein
MMQNQMKTRHNSIAGSAGMAVLRINRVGLIIIDRRTALP